MNEDEIEEILYPLLDNAKNSIEEMFELIERLLNNKQIKLEQQIKLENYIRDSIREVL